MINDLHFVQFNENLIHNFATASNNGIDRPEHWPFCHLMLLDQNTLISIPKAFSITPKVLTE